MPRIDKQRNDTLSISVEIMGFSTCNLKMTPWHTEYFKLKEFEKKKAESGRSLWTPETGHKTLR